MRNFFRLFSVFMLFISSFFVYSCKEDVNSELYSPKLYLHSPLKMGVTAKSEVVQSPSSIIMPEDVVEFYVYLSQEQDKDIVVSVVENPNAVKYFDPNIVALPKGSVEFVENNVVIPAGATVSTVPIRVRLQQNEAIKNLETQGLIALQITTPSGVDVLQERSICYWTILKSQRNIYQGNLEGLAAIHSSDITLTANTLPTLLRRLYDNRENTQWYCENEGWVTAQFKNALELKAVAVWPYGNQGSYTSSPRKIELQTSTDGIEWTSLGIMEFALPNTYTPLVLQLYSPIVTQYVRTKFVEGYSTTIRIAEMKFY